MQNINELENKLNYQFKNTKLLQQAITHSSADLSEHYERLEFIGDAVLDLAIADLLIRTYPQASEGELSRMRAALVNTNSLANAAKELELSKYIKLSKSETEKNGAERPAMLADVLEAIIGAIFLDSGYNAARESIEYFYKEKIANIVPNDPKTELQETLHSLNYEPPIYILDRIEGPEHAPRFFSMVKVNNQVFGKGSGVTKKASQQEAASEALEIIKNLKK